MHAAPASSRTDLPNRYLLTLQNRAVRSSLDLSRAGTAHARGWNSSWIALSRASRMWV